MKLDRRAALAYIAESQAREWEALEKALDRAINGAWSMEAEWAAIAALKAAKLTKPLSQAEVSWNLVAGGVYDRLLEIAKIPSPMSEEEWTRYERVMVEYRPAYARPLIFDRYKATRAALADPNNIATIREELGL